MVPLSSSLPTFSSVWQDFDLNSRDRLPFARLHQSIDAIKNDLLTRRSSDSSAAGVPLAFASIQEEVQSLSARYSLTESSSVRAQIVLLRRVFDGLQEQLEKVHPSPVFSISFDPESENRLSFALLHQSIAALRYGLLEKALLSHTDLFSCVRKVSFTFARFQQQAQALAARVSLLANPSLNAQLSLLGRTLEALTPAVEQVQISLYSRIVPTTTFEAAMLAIIDYARRNPVIDVHVPPMPGLAHHLVFQTFTLTGETPCTLNGISYPSLLDALSIQKELQEDGDEWTVYCQEVMLGILREKFIGKEKGEYLKATLNAHLVATLPEAYASLWSPDIDIGQLLMQVRKECGGLGIVPRPS